MPAPSSMVATSFMSLLSPGHMVSMTEEPIFTFYFILINLNLHLNSHTWLVATILDMAALETMSDGKKKIFL